MGKGKGWHRDKKGHQEAARKGHKKKRFRNWSINERIKKAVSREENEIGKVEKRRKWHLPF